MLWNFFDKKLENSGETVGKGIAIRCEVWYTTIVKNNRSVKE